jgi:hypothetical protein
MQQRGLPRRDKQAVLLQVGGPHMIDEDDAFEVDVLELLAQNPSSYFSPLASSVVKELADNGLAIFSEGMWYPTAQGLTRSGRTLH